MSLPPSKDRTGRQLLDQALGELAQAVEGYSTRRMQKRDRIGPPIAFIKEEVPIVDPKPKPKPKPKPESVPESVPELVPESETKPESEREPELTAVAVGRPAEKPRSFFSRWVSRLLSVFKK